MLGKRKIEVPILPNEKVYVVAKKITVNKDLRNQERELDEYKALEVKCSHISINKTGEMKILLSGNTDMGEEFFYSFNKWVFPNDFGKSVYYSYKEAKKEEKRRNE